MFTLPFGSSTRLSLARLCTIACMLLAAGCSNIPTDFRFDPAKNNGVVLGSVSFESGIGKYALIAVSEATPKGVEFSFGCTMFPCGPVNDDAFSAGEQPPQRGGGFAVEVPAGTYRIIGWRVQQGVQVTRSTAPADLEFKVEKGKISYLGNLHFDGDWQDVKLRDKAARDLPILQARHAALKDTPVAFTIAPGAQIGRLGGPYRTRIEQPLYVPVVR